MCKPLRMNPPQMGKGIAVGAKGICLVKEGEE